MWVEGIAEPIVAGRTERTILGEMGSDSRTTSGILDEALDLAERVADEQGRSTCATRPARAPRLEDGAAAAGAPLLNPPAEALQPAEGAPGRRLTRAYFAADVHGAHRQGRPRLSRAAHERCRRDAGDGGLCALPDREFDEIVAQCRRALAWVSQTIAAYGGDPQRLYIAGESAGAHLRR